MDQSRARMSSVGGLVRQPGRATRRSARTVLGATADEARTIVGTSDVVLPIAPRLGRYVFEPDAAVLAAGLEGTLAAEWSLAAIAPSVAYWTGDKPVADPAVACFEVEESLPFRVKTLKPLLRARGVGRLEIKQRAPRNKTLRDCAANSS